MKIIMVWWIPSAWKTTLARKLSLITWFDIIHTDDVYNSVWIKLWYKYWDFPDPKHWWEVDWKELESLKFAQYNNKLVKYHKSKSEWVIIEWYWMSFNEDREMIKKLEWNNIFFIYKEVDFYKWIENKWVEDNLERLEEYKKLKWLEELNEDWIIYL